MAGGTKDNYKSGIPQMWPDGANLDWRLTIADFISFWQVQWVNLKWKKAIVNYDGRHNLSTVASFLLNYSPISAFFYSFIKLFFSVICVREYFDAVILTLVQKNFFSINCLHAAFFRPPFIKSESSVILIVCLLGRMCVCAWWRPRALCVPLIESENGGPPPKSAPPRFFVLAKTSYAGPR